MKFLLLALTLLGLASLYVNRMFYEDRRELRAELSHQRKEIESLQNQVRKQAVSQDESQIAAETQTVARIEQAIATKRADISKLNDRLVSIKNQSDGGRTHSNIEYDITKQKDLIQDLERQLKSLQDDKSGLNQNTKYNEEQIKARHLQEESDLNDQIHNQETVLTQMQNQFNDFKSQSLDITARQSAAQLKPQIANQKQVIANLKNQKAGLNNKWNQEKLGVHGQSQQHISELNVQENLLRERIKKERGVLEDFQKRLRDEGHTLNSEKNSITELQKSLQTATSELNGLSEQLGEHQKHLQGLQKSSHNP